jgi:hypothetical protein
MTSFLGSLFGLLVRMKRGIASFLSLCCGRSCCRSCWSAADLAGALRH